MQVQSVTVQQSAGCCDLELRALYVSHMLTAIRPPTPRKISSILIDVLQLI
jgi:hypothetical protein